MRITAIVIALVLAALPASADLVITEIMQNPSAVYDSNGEWFEVYNPGPGDVDMDGYTISDLGSDSFTIAGTLLVAADDYAVFCVNGDYATNGGVDVDYVYPSGFYIGNSADEIYIYDASSTLVDYVEYDGGAVWPDPNGHSMYFSGVGDNNDGTLWAEEDLYTYGDGDYGTPGYERATPVENETWGAIKTLYR